MNFGIHKFKKLMDFGKSTDDFDLLDSRDEKLQSKLQPFEI